MFKRFSFILVLSILCLTIPLAALAAKPDSGKNSFFFPGDPLVFCDYDGEDDDFLILDDLLTRVLWNDFYDKEGNLIRHSEKWSFDDDLYHEDFPEGIRLKGNAQENSQYSFDGDSVKQKSTGVSIRINVPGIGHLFFQAGQMMFVDGELVYVHGKNHDWIQWEVEAICDYFSDQ
jgi:hypothetical protein